MNKKIKFKGGWWAELKTAWSYGADAKIAGAWHFADDADSFERATLIHLQEGVVSAHLPDVDGNAVPFGPDMWQRVDGRLARHLLRESRDLWAEWQKDADPKDTVETSSESPQD